MTIVIIIMPNVVVCEEDWPRDNRPRSSVDEWLWSRNNFDHSGKYFLPNLLNDVDEIEIYQ